MEEKKEFRLIDLGKFLACMGVVAIHEPLFPTESGAHHIEEYLLSICVPIFFALSAFLFFRKTIRLPFSNGFNNLLHFCKRLGILYFAWMPVYFLLTPHLEADFLNLSIFKQLVFGHTYFASWFISALFTGTIVMFFLSRISVALMLAVGTGVYIYTFCCADKILPISGFYDWYNANIHNFGLSFPYSLPWIALGACMAVAEQGKQRLLLLIPNGMLVAFQLLAIAITPEYREVLSWIIRFFLIEVAVFVCCNLQVHCNLPFQTLRKMSTVVYFSHIYLIVFLPTCGWWLNLNLKLPLTLFCTTLFAFFFVWLSHKQRFSFLRHWY